MPFRRASRLPDCLQRSPASGDDPFRVEMRLIRADDDGKLAL